MADFKVDKINGLEREVQDFHPLLNNLFKKLNGVINVEYTQGSREMGADFILKKSDQALGGEEYVGVIVKVGSINQSHAEVDRQIEECEIERTVDGGKKKIYITEVWVVASGKITQNAQDKIHHKYKNKSIKFIDQRTLINLIDKNYPDYWNDIPTYEGVYLEEVRATAVELGSYNAMGHSASAGTYIPQELEKIESGKDIYRKIKRQRKLQRLTLPKILENESLVLVEAIMGSGKTTLLSHNVLHYASNEVYVKEKKLPIFLTAKSFEKSIDELSDNEEWLDKFLKERKIESQKECYVFIDAMDEACLNSGDRLSFIQRIRDICQVRKDVKFVVTSRSFGDPHIETELDGLCSRYILCSLTIPQVVGLVRSMCSNSGMVQKLEQDLDKSPVFKALPKTPISAILLARILQENVQEIPSTMTDLYSKYMELVLGRWDMHKGLQSQIEYDVINNVVINIAKFMLDNRLVEVPVGDIKGIYDNYVKTRKFSIDKTALFDKIVNKREVFYLDSDKNVISFRHRTFAEYFYAESMKRDNSAVITSSVYEMYWSASYFFYLGLKRDCPDIIQALDGIAISDEKSHLSKLVNHGQFLLAAYLTPYDYISESLNKSFSDVAQLYKEAVDIEKQSELQRLSKVQLAAILTYCLCMNYGYEYFSDAIKERALDLSSSPKLDDKGMVELFFLNSVLLSNNDEKAFDYMIKNYGKDIPLELQVVMLDHFEGRNAFSTVVDKFAKKLLKSARKNVGMNKAIESLCNDPISSNKVVINKISGK